MRKTTLFEFGLVEPLSKPESRLLHIRSNYWGIENMKRNFKKVEDNIFKFEKVGDTIEGELQAVEIGANFGNKVYKIKGDDAKINVVFGTIVLESLMSAVSIGDYVKIEFAGTKENKKAGQEDIKTFDVSIAE